jgi:Uma2 family endonuclease
MPIAAPRYTVEDLDAFPDDGQHYELLDGVLLVTPAPAQRHQAILARLMAPLLAAVLPSGQGMVASPGRIQSGKRVRLEPDILVYPAPANREANWTDIKSWWLAVEVLSPSTRVYDTEWKRHAYQALGVEAVWLAEPRGGTITTWLGADSTPQVFSQQLTWRPSAVPEIDVVIDVPGIFA